MLLDQARHQTRLFCLCYEFAEERGAGGIRLGRADRLLHGHEIPRQDFGAGKLVHVGEKLRPQRGTGLKFLGDELVERSLRRVREQELGLL